jgi:F-box domain
MPPQTASISDLPPELIQNIFFWFTHQQQLVVARLVCWGWYDAASDPVFIRLWITRLGHRPRGNTFHQLIRELDFSSMNLRIFGQPLVPGAPDDLKIDHASDQFYIGEPNDDFLRWLSYIFEFHSGARNVSHWLDCAFGISSARGFDQFVKRHRDRINWAVVLRHRPPRV